MASLEISTLSLDGRITLPKRLLLLVPWMQETVSQEQDLNVRVVIAESERVRLESPLDEEPPSITLPIMDRMERKSDTDRLSAVPVETDALWFRDQLRDIKGTIKFSGVSYRLAVPKFLHLLFGLTPSERKVGLLLIDGGIEIWSGHRVVRFFDIAF